MGEKKSQVDIDFRYNHKSLGGPVKKVPQTGYVRSDKYPSNSKWWVSPMWPLKLPFLIIELADDYSHTVIGYPSRQYAWIMARKHVMDEDVYGKLVKRLTEVHGYDAGTVEQRLVRVPH